MVIVWLGLAVINIFFLDPTRPELMNLLEASLLAGLIYEHNPFMAILTSFW